MNTTEVIEIVKFLVDQGGPWIALAILWMENRRIWAKLDQCFNEICDDDKG